MSTVPVPLIARTDLYRVAELLAMAASESRLRVLMVLADGPLNVSRLVEAAGASSQQVMSNHLIRMRLVGLVDCCRRGKENHYDLTPLGRRLVEFAADPATAE